MCVSDFKKCDFKTRFKNEQNTVLITLRDRPFNLQGGGLWFFVSFRIFFSDNTRVRILIFFQNLTLGYMTKTLNQIIFFSNIGNQNIFLEKKHNLPWKLNGPSLMGFVLLSRKFSVICFID